MGGFREVPLYTTILAARSYPLCNVASPPPLPDVPMYGLSGPVNHLLLSVENAGSVRFGESYLTKFAPHMALRLTACGELTFDDRAVLHCAV